MVRQCPRLRLPHYAVAPMTHDPTHAAETDAIVAELEKAGLVTVTVRPDGQEAYTLTDQGERVGRMLALAGAEDAAVLNGLLDAAGGPEGPTTSDAFSIG